MENYNWLKNETPQIILFRDRKHYVKKGVLHNVNGPAIEPINNSSIPAKYYIKGQKYSYDKWVKESTVIKRRRKLKKVKTEE